MQSVPSVCRHGGGRVEPGLVDKTEGQLTASLVVCQNNFPQLSLTDWANHVAVVDNDGKSSAAINCTIDNSQSAPAWGEESAHKYSGPSCFANSACHHEHKAASTITLQNTCEHKLGVEIGALAWEFRSGEVHGDVPTRVSTRLSLTSRLTKGCT